MKFEIKDLEKCRKEIRAIIDFKELEPFIAASTKLVKENFSLNGFRKGKVPEEIVNKNEGEKILFESAWKAIEEFYPNILKDSQIEAIGKPEITILKMAWGNPLEFKIDIWSMPEIELPDYKAIAAGVKRKKIFVEDNEVEDAVSWISKTRSQKVEKNSPCEAGDFVEIEYSSPDINAGEKLKEGFIIGQNHVLPEFESNIVGLAAGQQKNFSIKKRKSQEINQNNGPDGKEAKDFSQETALNVKLEKVYSLIPPKIDDQWAKTLGKFENLSQLKESLKDGILAEKKAAERQRVQAEVISKIGEGMEFEIPKILIDFEIAQAVRDLKEKIPQTFQMSFDDYLKQAKMADENDFKKSLLPNVEKKIRNSLILRAIQAKEKIAADQKEIKEAADEVLTRYNSAKEAGRKIDPDDLYEYTKEKIEIRKTLEYLEALTKD